MAKYYVQSGPVKLVFQASSAHRAAIRAFEWSCEKQNRIQASTPLEHVLEAERRGWQLHEEIHVSERGFGADDGVCFDTVRIVVDWQACTSAPLPCAGPSAV